MARLQKKAEKAVEKVFLKEILKRFDEIQQQNDEEKEISHSQIMEMLDTKCKELEKKIIRCVERFVCKASGTNHYCWRVH